MSDTQAVLDAAEQLGKLLADHPALKRLSEAQKMMSSDTEAVRLLGELEREYGALEQQAATGQPVSQAQRQRVSAIQQTIASNLKVKAFSIAQKELSDLLLKVSQTWQRPVSEAQQAGRADRSAPAPQAPRLVVPG